MNWQELRIETEINTEEIISEFLWLLGSTGVSIKDSNDFLNLPDDGFGTIKGAYQSEAYAEHPIVLGYFEGASQMDGIVFELRQLIDEYNRNTPEFPIIIYQIAYQTIVNDDWANKWKEYYHPIQISRFLSIIPVWETYTPMSDTEICLYLDPGMAFGTGSHPTTELILNLMETVLRPEDQVIDVGTGSGILAIAAKKLGASRVEAYEYDASIIPTAEKNISLNENMDNVTVTHNDKLNGVAQQVDVITANILTEILLPLLPQAYINLKKDGALLLSGIYIDQIEVMKQDLIANDFRIEQIIQRGEWFAIYARKGREDRCKDTL